MPPLNRPRQREIEKPARPLPANLTTSVTSGPTYTVLPTDRAILVDDDRAGQAVRVVLPAAANSRNRDLHIKKIGSSYAVTVDGSGSETIDGSTTQIIVTQYNSMHIRCDGTEWSIL